MAPRDAYLQAAVAYGWGMRILRQDLWEVIVSFIVSQNNNIPRIRKNLRDLCAMQGGFHLIPVGSGELFRFCCHLRKCFCC